ncbi:uncharacterized protein LOC115379732 isoform X2 [Myripristis murdjan]|uniref:uncharacterized protein LOC115379732 isoform X2 n=1 Tax=Myripristis murdjan TaxID=586833 RepID=UPI00117637F0|nr:uncharacterized protein LOC115379732 isoform X2 [Myripristis murdjan]
MAGDCTYNNAHYGNTETFCPSKLWSDGDGAAAGEMDSVGNLKGRGPTPRSPNFEVIDGLLYRKKLEKGFINYREVLHEDRRHEAISTFHRRRPGLRHLSLEETYKCVAENYWWEGMYFQIRDFVLGCPECPRQCSQRSQDPGGGGRVSKTMTSHGDYMLSKLRSQREAGLFCDITLRTDGRSYSAHRAVLAAVSEYFQEIFTEMDSSTKTDVDLTGFSEESLLSLLDFSYSSTLCVRQEDLPEVSAMARHLGMWPAVEACSALLKEQEQPPSRCPKTENPSHRFPSASGGPRHELQHQQREKKRRRISAGEDKVNHGFSLTLDASDESLEESPKRNLRGPPRLQPQGHNGLPLSPTHRMKLMDFKSPSSKKNTATRNSLSTPQSRNCATLSPSNTRLLRSTPGAAQEVQKLLPRPESPRRNKKSHSIPLPPCTSRQRPGSVCNPVRVKQEVEELGEDEEDYARAQEKYRLMSVLGLQRTALLPRPEDLIGWRQKKRLRKLKANNYSLTKRRKPRTPAPEVTFGDLPLSLPLCNPVNTRLISRVIKTEPAGPVSIDEIRVKRPRSTPRPIPPSDRSMRSKGTLPEMLQPSSRPSFGGRELRRSVRRGNSAPPPSQSTPRHANSKALARKTVRIKAEPAEYSISGTPLPTNSRRRHTPRSLPPPLRSQARSKVAAETVKTLRYNSGRPVTKAKLRRNTTREPDKTQWKTPRREVTDTSPRVHDNESIGLQISDHVPPPSIYNHPLYKVIKEEPADPLPVAGPFPDPPSPDLGKRQSKPPIKLLDPGFLFSFCRPAGGPMAVVKREEETVDICLTRSVSQVREKFGAEEPPHRALRARGGSHTVPQVKRETEERSVSQSRVQRAKSKSHSSALHLAKSTGSKTVRTMPKQGKCLPLSGKRCVLLESIRRARLKQLRGPRSQAPKAPKGAHACPQCHTSYRDCDALIMHRLRHIEGKHWPCPLCSKTFFRLRNVRNHIRTHDQKLYKCRSCIAASAS